MGILRLFPQAVGTHGRDVCGPAKPHALASCTVRLHKDDAAGVKRAAHCRGGGPLQRVLATLEPADGAAADLRAFGKLVLGPVEEGPSGPTLRWRKGHKDEIGL
jgi:hypothetical protein